MSKYFDHFVLLHYANTREAYSRQKVYWSHTSVCFSVCVSVAHHIPTLMHGPGCNLGEW